MKLASRLFRVRPKHADIEELGDATAELRQTLNEAQSLIESIRQENAREERRVNRL